MAEVLVQLQEPLSASGSALYTARVCGRSAPDGGWEGWIEFVSDDALLDAETPEFQRLSRPELAERIVVAVRTALAHPAVPPAG